MELVADDKFSVQEVGEAENVQPGDSFSTIQDVLSSCQLNSIVGKCFKFNLKKKKKIQIFIQYTINFHKYQ